MSQAVWFYAHAEGEGGPVTAAELKALAESGQLTPDDLVWKEGMNDWAPASEVRGLFLPEMLEDSSSSVSLPADPPSGPPPAPPRDSRWLQPAGDPLPAVQSTGSTAAEASLRRRLTIRPLTFSPWIGQPLLLIGLLGVLLARGCDGLGNRYIARISAEVQVAQTELAAEEDLDAEQRQKRLEEIQEMQEASKLARANNQISGYWREMAFVFGSVLLSVGLLATGFTSEGAARWICLIMLAIITFSLYVGGIAWASSISSMLR